MRQKKQRRWRFGLAALGVFGVAMMAGIFALGNSVAEIRETEVAHSPSVLLANAGAKEDKLIALPVTYFDQISDVCVDVFDKEKQAEAAARQWEWTSCGYKNKGVEKGLAEKELGENGLPVATGDGKMMSSRGVNFEGWFEEMEGISGESEGTLSMHYQRDGAYFSFMANDFYPLDEVKFSEGDPVNIDGHNHLFTMNFVVPITVLGSGEETFLIRADDDTLVFLDNQLVIDMGGVHEETTGEMLIDSDGQVYARVEGEEWKATGVSVAIGEAAQLAVFHADRDASESVLELGFWGMDLALVSGAQIASVSGVEAAAGEGMEFVAPLGESRVFEPNTAGSLLVVATIEGVLVIVLAILTVAVARFVVRQKLEG